MRIIVFLLDLASISSICRSSAFTKKPCVLIENCCVLLVFILPELVWFWCHIITQIFHVLFLYNIEIIHPWLYNIQLRFTSLNINYLGCIISVKKKYLEYLLNIIAFIFFRSVFSKSSRHNPKEQGRVM